MTASEAPARSWGHRFLLLWEGLLFLVGLLCTGIAPFSCCWFYLFAGGALTAFWLAFLPRLLAGPPASRLWLENLRLPLIASWPISACLLWVWTEAKGALDLGLPPLLQIPPEWAWTGTIVLVGLLGATLLRRWLGGRIDTQPWRSPLRPEGGAWRPRAGSSVDDHLANGPAVPCDRRSGPRVP